MSKEIVKACVKYNDRLYTGFEHGECFNKLNEDNTIIVFDKIEQGFIDNEGNFVDRKQAMIIAKENSQLSYETNKKTLISEDLHLDWLNRQAKQIADLKAKLAESEARIACREDNIKFKEADINQLKWILGGKEKDIDQLKQQLAEKDLKIIELETKLNLKDKETNV